MKIDSSMIGMESARSYTSKSQRTVGYSVWGQKSLGSLNTSLSDAGSTGGEGDVFSDILNAKGDEDAKVGARRFSRGAAGHVLSSRVSSTEEQKSIEQIKAQCVQYLIYWLFGGKNARSEFQRMLDDMRNGSAQNNAVAGGFDQMTLQTTESEYYEEREDTSFSTTGTVRTADGREINFNLDLTMSRSFQEYYETNYTKDVVQMVDPLVINLNSNIASLSDQKFEFDLDADGVKDTISMLNAGSGYLALDKNGDGIINDGSELFGTRSGDGFSDLAAYDEDGNGWIDENDEIFDKLLVWSKNEKGEDELYTLKQAGVGAICLQKASTNFSLNNLKNNQVNGAIRATGIFLYENGNVGTMQHIDVAQ
ncbi:MAG: hypothetical protein IJ711_01065 [Lachnospiraceae bacterium]|nr:hypothetical protein [Lachnospiraceae bacterium]